MPSWESQTILFLQKFLIWLLNLCSGTIAIKEPEVAEEAVTKVEVAIEEEAVEVNSLILEVDLKVKWNKWEEGKIQEVDAEVVWTMEDQWECNRNHKLHQEHQITRQWCVDISNCVSLFLILN